MECVEKIKLDTSMCLLPCSGLMVTGFSKSEQKSLENLSPILGDYNNYKSITPYPPGKKGKDSIERSISFDHVLIIDFIFRLYLGKQAKICKGLL